MGQSYMGNAKTPRKHRGVKFPSLNVVVWVQMAPRGSPLRARSKQRNREIEGKREKREKREVTKQRNRETVETKEEGRGKRRKRWKRGKRGKLPRNKSDEDLTRPGHKARRI